MKTKSIYTYLFLLFFVSGCGVISPNIAQEALPQMDYRKLTQIGNDLVGKTVILGGYILETQNKNGFSTLRVLQTPLSSWQEPLDKDASKGRFTVIHKGFLDPEIYKKNRKITVAGVISGYKPDEIGNCPYTCLQINSREIYLWPEYSSQDYWYSPYYPYDPFYHPYYNRFDDYYYPYYPYSRRYRYPPYW